LCLEVIPNTDYFKHLGGSYDVVKQGKERSSGGEVRIDLSSLPLWNESLSSCRSVPVGIIQTKCP